MTLRSIRNNAVSKGSCFNVADSGDVVDDIEVSVIALLTSLPGTVTVDCVAAFYNVFLVISFSCLVILL